MPYHTHFDFDESLRKLLQTALHRYRRRYDEGPAALIVHPNNQDGVRRLLDDLDLPDIEVEALPGCLWPEVWMQAPGGGQQ